MIWPLFAQADTTALTGNSGWYGVGILGVFIGWLLFFEIPLKNKLIQDLIVNGSKALADAQAKYDDSLKMVVESNEKNLKAIVSELKKEICRHPLENGL